MDTTNLQNLIMTLLVVLTGLFGMPITNWLKQQFNLKDQAALLLAGAVSAVLALGVLWANGQLLPEAVTFDRFPEILSAVFTVATVFYKILRYGKEDTGDDVST